MDFEILTDVVKELLSDNPLDLPLEDEPLDQTMYVLTNKLKLYGACCILYKNLLEEFAEQQGCDQSNARLSLWYYFSIL